MKTRIKITIALAAAILVIGFFIIPGFFQSPQNIFRRLVAKPIPASVQSLEEGHFLTMDSTFWALHFQMNKADLGAILNAQHFTLIDEVEKFKRWDVNSNSEVKIEKEEYLDWWKKQIHLSAKLDVSFGKSWQIFVLKEGHGTKYLFFDTNSTEVVFVADAH